MDHVGCKNTITVINAHLWSTSRYQEFHDRTCAQRQVSVSFTRHDGKTRGSTGRHIYGPTLNSPVVLLPSRDHAEIRHTALRKRRYQTVYQSDINRQEGENNINMYTGYMYMLLKTIAI